MNKAITLIFIIGFKETEYRWIYKKIPTLVTLVNNTLLAHFCEIRIKDLNVHIEL